MKKLSLIIVITLLLAVLPGCQSQDLTAQVRKLEDEKSRLEEEIATAHSEASELELQIMTKETKVLTLESSVFSVEEAYASHMNGCIITELQSCDRCKYVWNNIEDRIERHERNNH